MWFKKKMDKKQKFVSIKISDNFYADHKGKSIGEQINEFQEKGFEFVGIIGAFYSEHSNCNYANVLFKKVR